MSRDSYLKRILQAGGMLVALPFIVAVLSVWLFIYSVIYIVTSDEWTQDRSHHS